MTNNQSPQMTCYLTVTNAASNKRNELRFVLDAVSYKHVTKSRVVTDIDENDLPALDEFECVYRTAIKCPKLELNMTCGDTLVDVRISHITHEKLTILNIDSDDSYFYIKCIDCMTNKIVTVTATRNYDKGRLNELIINANQKLIKQCIEDCKKIVAGPISKLGYTHDHGVWKRNK